MKRIALSGKRGAGKFVLVDDDDFYLISKLTWHVSGPRQGYALRAHAYPDGHRGALMLHHLVLPPKAGVVVDHKNLDHFDCQRSNLRYVTYTQNSMNRRGHGTSGFKGVSRSPGGYRWRATLYIDGKNRHLGDFRDIEDAARAYDSAAFDLHGEYAYLNEY